MSELCDQEIVLKLRETVPADPSRGWLKTLHYDIYRKDGDVKVGTVDLRLGYTTSVVRYGGHFGYSVAEPYRGHRYAAKACKLLLPVAKSHGMDVIWITCNPDNWASRKTCEHLGATLVEIVDLPPDNDQYQEGERQKCRYRVIVY